MAYGNQLGARLAALRPVGTPPATVPHPLAALAHPLAASPAAKTEEPEPYDVSKDPSWASMSHVINHSDFRDYINGAKPADRSKLLHMLHVHGGAVKAMRG